MKILFVASEGIGNMVMALPTIQALCEMEHEVSLLGKALPMRIVSNRFVEKRYEIDSLDNKLVDDFDYIALSVWDSQREILMPGKRVFAYFQKDQHEANANFQIAQELGYQESMPMPICATDPFKHEVEKNAIAVCDGYANEHWARKSWPDMMNLVKLLLGENYPVYLIGDKRDSQRQPLDFDIRRHLKLHDLRGFLLIQESSWLLSQMACVVANDTGMAHVAASHGVPTLVLFGATLQSKNRPLGERVQAISAGLECSPCSGSCWLV